MPRTSRDSASAKRDRRTGGQAEGETGLQDLHSRWASNVVVSQRKVYSIRTSFPPYKAVSDLDSRQAAHVAME